jgi:hypothetical protein
MAQFTARGEAFRFPKGQSGNPDGQSRLYHECREIAREASPEMMRGLVDLARTAEDERVRLVCLIAVLDRAGVRPIDYIPAEDAAARKPGSDKPMRERGRYRGRNSPRRRSSVVLSKGRWDGSRSTHPLGTIIPREKLAKQWGARWNTVVFDDQEPAFEQRERGVQMPTAACSECGATVTVTESRKIEIDYEAMGKLCKTPPPPDRDLMATAMTRCPYMNEALRKAYPPRPMPGPPS